MPKKYPYYLLTAAFFILGLSIGFFASRVLTPTPSENISETPSNNISSENNEDNLYSSQTASIHGEISNVNNKSLTIKNLSNNEIGVKRAASRILITKAGSRTPTSELSAVELNKEALITLEKSNGGYEVTQIQFILPAPSLPPIPTLTTNPVPSASPN